MWNGVDFCPDTPSLQMVNVIGHGQAQWGKIISPWIFRCCGVSPAFGDESGCGLEWCCMYVLNCQL